MSEVDRTRQHILVLTALAGESRERYDAALESGDRDEQEAAAAILWRRDRELEDLRQRLRAQEAPDVARQIPQAPEVVS